MTHRFGMALLGSLCCMLVGCSKREPPVSDASRVDLLHSLLNFTLTNFVSERLRDDVPQLPHAPEEPSVPTLRAVDTLTVQSSTDAAAPTTTEQVRDEKPANIAAANIAAANELDTTESTTAPASIDSSVDEEVSTSDAIEEAEPVSIEPENSDGDATQVVEDKETSSISKRNDAETNAASVQVEALYGAGPGYTGEGAGSGYTGVGAGARFTGIGAGQGYTGEGAGTGYTGVGAGDSGFTGIGASKSPRGMPATTDERGNTPNSITTGNGNFGIVTWPTIWGPMLMQVPVH